MPREIPEWVGKTDDTPAPTRVRLRVFDAHGGKCAECGVKLGPATPWDLDHTVALVNGGENAEGKVSTDPDAHVMPCDGVKDAYDEYIRADLAPQWQDIATAPKDGTRIMAYWPDVFGNASATQTESWYGPRGAVWGVNDCWQSCFEWDDGHNSPTHWMPLPTPPDQDP